MDINPILFLPFLPAGRLLFERCRPKGIFCVCRPSISPLVPTHALGDDLQQGTASMSKSNRKHKALQVMGIAKTHTHTGRAHVCECMAMGIIRVWS